MLQRLRNRQKGFTLIELLIVVAIIGIIAAMLIPNFLDALQKAKQKRTVADIRNVGTAMMSWLTDQIGGAAAGRSSTTGQVDMGSYVQQDVADLQSILSPQYIQQLPEKDGWKNNYVYYLNTENPLAAQVMAIFSGARDGSDPETEYTTTNFDPTDYNQDIVWADGFFVRWPQKQSTQ
jgi:type IV pilus assembly protein PilA